MMIACGKMGARSAGPIGCRVCGLRYGAGGAGMSGRMLYQRSGMSLSSSRIFLFTAPSLLNEFGTCPRTPRLFLPGQVWPPAPVPRPLRPLTDQLEARPRPVGAARRRLAGAALELHGPLDPMALVGRRVQRPGRVVNVGAPEGAEVGAPGEDDRVHVVVAAD